MSESLLIKFLIKLFKERLQQRCFLWMLHNLQEQTTLKKIWEPLLLDLESKNPLNFEYLVQISFLHTCHKYTLSITSESCTTFHNFSNVYKGYQSNLNMSLCFIKNLSVKLYRLMLPMLGTSSSLHKKWSFPLKIFSLLNVTESAASCGFVHIYWRRNP